VLEEGAVAGLELAGDDDEAIGQQGLAGDAGVGFHRQEGVEYGVRHAVGELVRVAFGDRLGRE
jgi:hypothetical protein